MIRAALNIIGLESGETVLDPFVGSGTTALEAQLLGVNCIGLDASPLCVLQSRVKTASREVIKEIRAQCEALPAPSRGEAGLDEKALKLSAVRHCIKECKISFSWPSSLRLATAFDDEKTSLRLSPQGRS